MNQIFKIIRVSQGIKQTDIANKVGITQQAIALYESGKSTLSNQTLCKIAPLININTKFLDDNLVNPFSSEKLIKMILAENFLGGVDYSIIYFLCEKVAKAEFVFLIAPLMRNKILSKTVFENQVYSILLRDNNNNLFIFKRKTKDPLVGERELQLKAKEIAQHNKNEIYFRIQRIDEKIKNKISKWTIVKEDVVEFFSQIENPINNEVEWEIIKKIRETKDGHNKVLEFLKQF